MDASSACLSLEKQMRQPPLLETMFAVLVVVLAVGASIRAEEGMWTFDNFPIARANQALGSRIDQAWLDRVRLSSVRFGGCSAGIVSADGLVMTNNHCVATCVANLSTPTVNYAETGFTPRRREDEVKCPGALAEVLLSITDVTPAHAGRQRHADRPGVHRGARCRGRAD